jgi:hypothetical protein
VQCSHRGRSRRAGVCGGVAVGVPHGRCDEVNLHVLHVQRVGVRVRHAAVCGRENHFHYRRDKLILLTRLHDCVLSYAKCNYNWCSAGLAARKVRMVCHVRACRVLWCEVGLEVCRMQGKVDGASAGVGSGCVRACGERACARRAVSARAAGCG